MKLRVSILLGLSLLLLVSTSIAQTDNTLYVRAFKGTDVGTKVTNAMATCNPSTVIPCILVIDPSLAAYPAGTMPTLCSHCSVIDYRNGSPLGAGYPGVASPGSGSLAGAGALNFADLNLSGPGCGPSTYAKGDGTGCGAAGGYYLSLLQFGGVGDERDLYDCSVTASSPTLTCPDGAFTSADNGRKFLVRMGAKGVVTAAVTSVSGATISGGACVDNSNASCGYCNVTITGGAANATGRVYQVASGLIPVGQTIVINGANMGTGFSSAPATAALSNGTMTCSGSVAISSTLGLAPVLTAGTVVNSTQVILGTAATSSLSSTAFASIGTDNSTSLQNWINACEAATASGTCYVPAGQYAYLTAPVVASPITIMGDGAQADLGPVTGGGAYTLTFVLPAQPPFVTGSVLVPLTPGGDGLDVAGNGQSITFRGFGVRFPPPNAFWYTGHGFEFNAAPSNHGAGYGHFVELAVWGHDGNHYAYDMGLVGTSQMDFLNSWGGGGLNCVSCANNLFNSVILDEMTGGTAHNVSITGGANLNTWTRLQIQQYAYNSQGPVSTLANFYIPSQSVNQMNFYADSSVFSNTLVGVDSEGLIGGFYYYPSSTITLIGTGTGFNPAVLSGVPVNSQFLAGWPPVDFTGSAKTDGGSYLSLGAYQNTATAMPGNTISFIAKDFGAGYFAGNFQVNFQFKLTAGSSGSTTAAYLFDLSMANSGVAGTAGNNTGISVNVANSTTGTLYVDENYSGTPYFSAATGSVTVGTLYYCTFSRSGTQVSAGCWTNPLHAGSPTLSGSLGTHAALSYEYLYPLSSDNAALTPTASYLTNNFVVVVP
jgi:hypothetical protein